MGKIAGWTNSISTSQRSLWIRDKSPHIKFGVQKITDDDVAQNRNVKEDIGKWQSFLIDTDKIVTDIGKLRVLRKDANRQAFYYMVRNQ